MKSQSLPLLPALLQVSLLALLSAAIPLETTYATVSKSVPDSYHVFTFSGDGELLVAESEGAFALEAWDQACSGAEKECAETIQTLKSGWKR
jgi:exosome complex component RRP46